MKKLNAILAYLFLATATGCLVAMCIALMLVY